MYYTTGRAPEEGDYFLHYTYNCGDFGVDKIEEW